MVTFRKSLLLLAIISLVAVAANAQTTPPFQCVANAGVPPTVRAEGLAELVGDVVLNCTGGTPTAFGQQVPRINFRIFLNTNVTSRLLDGTWNEALLIIDEPALSDLNQCPNRSGCTAVGVGAEPGVPYADGTTPNVYQGTYITGNTASTGGNTVEWLGVPIDPPGTQASRVIRITNVRANAAQQGVGGLLIPSQLIMFISATGTTSMPINNPQQIVAFVQQGLDFSADDDSYLQCEDPSGEIDIEFSELFATAFKKRNQATSYANLSDAGIQASLNPKVEFNTETGFYAGSALPYNNADEAGLASQGTRLMAQFKNIPDGVTLYVTTVNDVFDDDVCANVSDPSCYEDIATIVEDGDANGEGDDRTTLAGALAIDDYDDADGWYQVPLSGGAGTAVWEIIQSNPFSTGSLTFQIMVDYEPNASAGIPALGTGAVAGSYAPLSTESTAIKDDLQPRFTDRSEDMDFMTVNSCQTNLLWPYVTNQAGFDTGMAISNTSMDPFGTATQEGKCTINYYGSVGAAGTAPGAAEVTPVIPAGGHAAWTLNGGGGIIPYGKPMEGVINGRPGFQGYVIAQCLFQYAHGYAFITKLGAVELAQGYVALVMDEPIDHFETRTGVKSEALNQ